MTFATTALVALLVVSLVVSGLAAVAAWRYLRARPGRLERPVPISLLKPLWGLDEGLQENLRSYFQQDYPEFEILFGVRQADDPAAAVVEKLTAEFPGVPARLVVTGEPSYPNAKVFALEAMFAQARHGLLVMTDSDTRAATPQMLRVIAAEFQDPHLGLTTCPYRAVPGRSAWSVLEAVGMNTEFLAGILVARMIEGMRFAVGPTMAARRETIERIGGFGRVKDYLAEDFMLGKLAAEAGWGVGLSSCVIEHWIGAERLRPNLEHRLRWVRSTRRSRPAGYIGQLLTYPLPLALLLVALRPSWWPLAAVAAGVRALAAWAVAGWVLHDPLTGRRWWLVPVQDLASFALWVAGFFGNTVSWRGRRYAVYKDGTFGRV